MEDKDARNQISQLQNLVLQLTQSVQQMSQKFSNHLHTGVDGSLPIRADINMQSSNSFRLGNSVSIDPGKSPSPAFINIGGGSFAQVQGFDISGSGATVYNSINIASEQNLFEATKFGGIAVGYAGTALSMAMNIDKYNAPTGAVASDSLESQSQVVLKKDYGNGDSSFYGLQGPSTAGSGSITSGGSTLTDTTQAWVTNKFSGAIISIVDGSNGESRLVVSNTATAITISGTWSQTTSTYKYYISYPIYCGSGSNPWKRVYTDEGTTGGYRFGIGKTADGSNGLLYMDASGDLYWRNKANASINIGSSIPSGAMFPYGGSSAPTGYLLCDGSAVSRTTYSALFTAISTGYGAGNGSTTFNVPDLRGKIPVGYHSTETEFDTLGETGGEKTHVLTTTEMPAHTHTAVYPVGSASNVGFSGGGWQNTVSATGSTGGDAAHNNLQPYQVTNYIIKT